MDESTIFIGAVIIALTQIFKYLAPHIHGAVTILIAVVAGALVAIFDTLIGLPDISVAQGVMIGLGAVGTVTTAQSFGSHTPPKGV